MAPYSQYEIRVLKWFLLDPPFRPAPMLSTTVSCRRLLATTVCYRLLSTITVYCRLLPSIAIYNDLLPSFALDRRRFQSPGATQCDYNEVFPFYQNNLRH